MRNELLVESSKIKVLIGKYKNRLDALYKAGLLEQNNFLFDLAIESPAAAFIILHSILNVKEVTHYSPDTHFGKNALVVSAASSVITGKPKLEVVSKLHNNRWILTGKKNICTGYNVGDIYLVRARNNSANTLYAVPRQAKGLSIGNELQMMGLDGSTGEVIFDRVNLPIENVIGEIGKAEEVISFDNYTGLHFGVLALGTAMGCYRETKKLMDKRGIDQEDYLTEIEECISNLLKQQKQNTKLIQSIISEDTSSKLVYKNTLLHKNIFAGASVDIIHNLLVIAGKNGYVRDNHLERYLRDAYGFYLTYPNVWSAHLEGLMDFPPRNVSKWSKALATASWR